MKWHVPVLLVAAIMLAACDPGFSFTFVNRTDSTLCFRWGQGGRPDTSNTDLCNEVMPQSERRGAVLCSDEGTGWAVLTVDGSEIYSRSTTCREWEASGLTITIEKEGSSFLVIDGLPTPTVPP